MPWIVIKFNKENKVDAVPTTWYNKQNKQCYWPPKKMSHKIAEFIKNQREPDESWKLFDATLLGVYDDFKYAQYKAEKAQTTDLLTSNDESLVLRKKKCTKKSEKLRVSPISSSSDSEISDDDSNEYPVQIDNFDVSTNKKRVAQRKNEHNTSFIEIDKTIEGEEKQIKIQLLELQECQKQYLKDINLLHLKIDAISESVSLLVKNTKTIVKSTNLLHEQLPILNLLPMDLEGLNQVEEWLQNEENKQNLVAELSKLGGPTVKEVVKRVMYKLFQNSLGMEYSWEGKRKKKVFKSLLISSVIMDVVRANKNTADCSEYEIIVIIKSWLVRSKERFYNNTLIRNDASKQVQTEQQQKTQTAPKKAQTKQKNAPTESKEIEQEETSIERTLSNEEQRNE
ncbi:uncharacterized protein LOC118646286 [Monomorium pharaonis]|uniref:uncharacterized protein LOC118646286 n=1 Tax=Monomorium pharaonis TaxID=307658 RepID=UPI0017467C91|nr:uncharacterized protein LOC118646286 [Monomorium pharaonis]